MSDNKIFAQEEALDRVDGDKELLFELFDMFFEDCDSRLEAIADAIANNNPSKLKEDAHSIKSALGNLGAMTSYDLAYKLELMGRDSDLNDAGNKFDEFKAEIAKFKELTDSFRAN